MKLKRISVLVSVLLCICFFGAITANADIYTAESGVDYKISEDGTYIIVIGYSDILPSVTIESEIDGLPVKEISKSAFQNHSEIYSVYIPDSVEVIGEAAFRNCPNLRSVRLPEGLTELPFECFRDCKLLNGLILPEGLKKIDHFCFHNCTKLGELKIPSSVNELGYDVFLHCESILLDCSENEYAASYAAEFNINTAFEGTSLYFAIMMGIGIAVAAVIALILIFLLRHHIKNHPSHDPTIYIARFFAMLGRGISFVLSKLKILIMIPIDYIISLLEKMEKRK